MWLVAVYVVTVLVGAFIAYLVGLTVDSYDKSLGMLAFLGVWFVSLYLGWKIAVRVTDPKRTAGRA